MKPSFFGDIIFYNSTKGGFYSAAQRFFTGRPYTHTAIFIGPILGHNSIFEADMVATVRPFLKSIEDESVEYEIWRVDTKFKKKENILKNLYQHFSARVYGFFQILWFMWRWAMEKLGKDVRKANNPFPSGDICSEIVFVYLEELAKTNKHLELFAKLNEYKRDNVHVADIVDIVSAFPDLFKKIEERKLDKN